MPGFEPPAAHHRISRRQPQTSSVGAWVHGCLEDPQRRFKHGTLDVGEVHAVEYDGDPTDVSLDAARLSGQPFSEVRAAERPCANYQQ